MAFNALLSIIVGLSLVSWASCGDTSAYGFIGSEMALGFGSFGDVPLRRQMLAKKGSKRPLKASSQAKQKKTLLDVSAKELRGRWVGATKSLAGLNPITGFPSCIDSLPPSCGTDLPLTMTIKIGGRKRFKYTLEKTDKSSTCPFAAESLSGKVTSFKKNRLSILYHTDDISTDKSNLQEAPQRMKVKNVHACLTMEVYVEDGKVKADVKLTLSYAGSGARYVQLVEEGALGFSKCVDEALACDFDFSDLSDMNVQLQHATTLECTSGKCLRLAKK